MDNCKLELSVQSLAEARNASTYCFFPMLLPQVHQVHRGEGGHSDDLRKRHPVRAKKTFDGTQVYKGVVKQNLV